MKRVDSLFLVLIVGCGALIWAWPRPEPNLYPNSNPDVSHGSRGKGQSTAVVAFTVADIERTPGNESCCGEGTRRWLYLFEENRRVGAWTVSDAVKLPGCVVLDSGRHKGQNGLPLVALLPDDKGDWDAMVIYPCRGEPLRLSAKALRKEPGRYVLVAARRGMLKLLDTEESGSKSLRSNLAAIRLVQKS